MARDNSKPGRISQLRQVYVMTKQVDPALTRILLLWAVGAAVVVGGLYYLLVGDVYFTPVSAILAGLLAALIVFGRRSQTAQYTQLEGKPGAAIAVLSLLKRGWVVEQQPIAFNKHQDVVSRVVGPPGIVLIGEGNPNRLKPLVTSEVRKHERVASEAPIHEIFIGRGDGQVSIDKLVKHVRKLPKGIQPAQMTDVLARLRALDNQRGMMPIPKGPVPTSMKGQRGGLKGR